MRLALFSDSHGNDHALRAVLANIDSAGDFDHIVFGGDLAWGGVGARACVDAIREREIDTVYGNADYYLWNPLPTLETDDENQRQYRDLLESYIAWTRDQLGDDGITFLREMPFSQTYSPTVNPADDLLVVHANPKNVFDPIFPDTDTQQKLFGEITQTDDEVRPLLDGTKTTHIAHGHIHIPNVRYIDDYTLFNFASVSRPDDGDLRAKYAVLEFTDGAWQIEHRYVAYDIDAAIAEVMASDVPGKQRIVDSLRQTG